MLRFNLVLADTDEWYIDSLGKFTRSTYTNKFDVNVFTREDSLIKFLTGSSCKVDILLAAPELLTDRVLKCNTGITIILSDGRGSNTSDGLPSVNKYQPGEKLLNEIIDLYSGINPRVESLVKGSKRTGIVSVFSPQGGSGKTVLSINLSLQFAKMGLKTFYLNLESVNCTNFFMNYPGNEYGLSYVLFYLKENSKNLAVKIDAAMSFDSRMNISYFTPADCSLEFDELTGADIGRLLFELQEMGRFDVIVVDTDSVLNSRNISVLSSSDSILMVLLQDVLTGYRLDIFDREIRKVLPDCEQNFYARVIPVVNKYILNSTIGDVYINGKTAVNKIPYVTDIYLPCGESYSFNPNNSMAACIKGLSGSIIEKLNITKL